MTKQRNRGLRKRCECPRKNWAKCSHPWHFNFKWKGEHYRFSLDREVGHPSRARLKRRRRQTDCGRRYARGGFGNSRLMPVATNLCQLAH